MAAFLGRALTGVHLIKGKPRYSGKVSLFLLFSGGIFFQEIIISGCHRRTFLYDIFVFIHLITPLDIMNKRDKSYSFSKKITYILPIFLG